MPYPPKRFVYIIVSVNDPDRRYVGVTADVTSRLAAHNAGQNRSTVQWRPWRLEVCVEFRSERTACRFEKYLKSGAGHAFANRHFVHEHRFSQRLIHSKTTANTRPQAAVDAAQGGCADDRPYIS